MSALQLPPLSLYIHIPWCERKCPYCDFNSHTAEGELPQAQYVDALMQDLEQDLAYAQGRTLHSIFIGGGTPSLLSAKTVAGIIDGVTRRIPLKQDGELTLEANPGSAEAEKFSGFVEAGVNRISLGVQSFDDKLLQSLGRVHDRDQALCAIEMAQGVGLDSLNIDLMHGLPGQTANSARADLQLAASFRPAHLSWYQLTIEPNTAFYKQPPVLPAEPELAAIQEQGEALLAGEGFNSYEVSAYARTGHRCHHNLNYWQFGDYLGIGAGAHSKLTVVAEQRVIRLAKQRQPGAYLAGSATGFRSAERVLDANDLVGEYMLNALRLDDGFAPGDFSARTGLDLAVIEPRLGQLAERGLLQETSDRIRATALGRRFLDSVIAEFF